MKVGQAGKSARKGLLAPSLCTRLLPGRRKLLVAELYRHVTSAQTSFPFLLRISVLPVALPLCVKNSEFRGRGRNVTSAEARLPCRKHVLPDRHASELPLGRAARVQAAVGSEGVLSYGISFRKNSSSPGVSGFPGKSRN